MARRTRRARETAPEPAPREPRIASSTKRFFGALALFCLALLLAAAWFDAGGPAGAFAYRLLGGFLGGGYLLLPLLAAATGTALLLGTGAHVAGNAIAGGIGALLSSLALLALRSGEGAGGLLGAWIARATTALVGTYVSSGIFLALLLGSFALLFEGRVSYDMSLFGWRPWGGVEPEDDEGVETEEPEGMIVAPAEVAARIAEETSSVARNTKRNNENDEDLFPGSAPARQKPAAYTPPPLSLLEKDSGKPEVGDLKANANIIKRTLANFGIDVEMDEISIGPSVTRYALKPAEGVKLSRIVGLQDNLALALAAHPLRIEAPIPGKPLVGIEIPNTTKTVVGLGSLFSFNEFQQSPHPLLFALGKGISGSAHFTNIAKAPHLLIAGATGSGKSVSIHTLIVSLLYRNSPEALRLILIDPKRVELTLYNRIPHLLSPVITDAKKAIAALKWATREMERRYGILEANSVRDVQSYHKNILPSSAEAEPLPYIVIIIDELADLMATYPREVEAAVVRLAQMSRAVGIHLVLSTQRPSVEVITGLIKANIPSRIALQVPSQIDSRTIIDMPGAEKLLGAGDMLYLAGDRARPERIQSAYISESEVKEVVRYLADRYESLAGEITFGSGAEAATTISAVPFAGEFGADEEATDDDDELYEQAREVVIQSGKASTSFLQRRLKVGYARAARLMDLLEERGVVGPANGAKLRDVYGRTEGPTAEGGVVPVAEDDETAEDDHVPDDLA